MVGGGLATCRQTHTSGQSQQTEDIMNQQSGPEDSLVLSYLTLRKAVGIIGCALPIVLALGKMLVQGPGLQCTISDYYYTDMGNVFVGSLCAIGVFLLSCRGYDRRDEIAGRLACVFAVGVALFPTNRCSGGTSPIGYLHLTFAALLFLTLAYFSIFLFTQTDPDKTPTPQKLQRNIVYRVFGYTILACILSIAIVRLTALGTSLGRLDPVFWLESLAVVSFGVSWLTKGETILKDKVA
jgi:cytochrome c biogenesis factor